VVATHDPALIAVADRVVELVDGAVVGDSGTTGRVGRHAAPWQDQAHRGLADPK
jgi:hypothetical protein